MMRSEREMFDLILRVAENDNRIRAAYLNGSRADSNVKKDPYQDFDVVYVVTEIASFLADRAWISLFGDIALYQEPDLNAIAEENIDDIQSYGWLILFQDGNRIDLHIELPEVTLRIYGTDTLTIPLLDKDALLPEIPLASDTGYWLKKPVESEYLSCCNNFWWCLGNVGKGIARDQFPYAFRMYFDVVHRELEKMTEWLIGIQTGYSVNVGMWGKYYKKYLSPELYGLYLNTYSDFHRDNFWAAVEVSCDLFRHIAKQVASGLKYTYNQRDDDMMMRYLERMRADDECNSTKY